MKLGFLNDKAMSFRFRKTFSVIPGIRLNVGKRGVSVSAGVRGAHVTFGKHGTRATVGMPGTGMSVTNYQRHDGAKPGVENSDAMTHLSPAAPAIAWALLIGVCFMARYNGAAHANVWAGAIIATAVCGLWLGIALQLNSDNREVEGDGPRTSAAKEVDSEKQRIDSAFAALQARMECIDAMPAHQEPPRKREQKTHVINASFKQQELATRLSKLHCYYRHRGETIGPVSLWQIHELVECGILSAGTQVILAGSDYWRSYAEMEMRADPSPKSQALAPVARKAAETRCYYFFNDNVTGPTTLLAIFERIHTGELPTDILVCKEGTSEWIACKDILSAA